MITNKEFCTWLNQIQPGVGYYAGPSTDTEDDALHVVVTPTSGAGFDVEQVIDRPGVQLRTIGVKGNKDDAEGFAWELDKAVLAGPFPLDIAGKRVIMINRIGGGPSPLNPGVTNRSNYVCSYLVQQAAE